MICYFHKIDDLGNRNVIESLRSLINLMVQYNDIQFDRSLIIDLLINIDLFYSFNCSSDWNKLKCFVNPDFKLLTILAANMTKISAINMKAYFEFGKINH